MNADHTPSRSVDGGENWLEKRPKYATLVISPMRCVRTEAMSAPAAPTPAASPQIAITRRSTGVYVGGPWTSASANVRDGATGMPSAGFSGLGAVESSELFPLSRIVYRERRIGTHDLKYSGLLGGVGDGLRPDWWTGYGRTGGPVERWTGGP